MLKRTFLAVSLLLALLCVAQPARAQIQVPDPPDLDPPSGENVCPTKFIEAGLSAVERFLTVDRHADKREQAGVTNLSMSDVRPLNSIVHEEDAARCEALDAKYSDLLNDYDEPFGANYMKAGDRYFVVLYPTVPERYPDDMVVMGIKLFMVLDEDLNRILGFAGG